jgi:hypothetical protein
MKVERFMEIYTGEKEGVSFKSIVPPETLVHLSDFQIKFLNLEFEERKKQKEKYRDKKNIKKFLQGEIEDKQKKENLYRLLEKKKNKIFKKIELLELMFIEKTDISSEDSDKKLVEIEVLEKIKSYFDELTEKAKKSNDGSLILDEDDLLKLNLYFDVTIRILSDKKIDSETYIDITISLINYRNSIVSKLVGLKSLKAY